MLPLDDPLGETLQLVGPATAAATEPQEQRLGASTLSPALKHFLAGGIGGMAGVVAGQPLDTIRIRLQQKGSRYAGVAHAWNSIISREGPTSLFKGMAYPLATVALQTAVTFYVYGTAMRIANPTDLKPSYTHVFSCGVLAGAAQSFVAAPVEVLKIRLQVQTATPGMHSYKGPIQMASQIVQRAGPQGLFRGLSITLLRDTPSHGVYFCAYHRIKELMNERSTGCGPAVGDFVAGGIAGVLFWPPVYPFDVVKSRMQVHDRTTSPYRNWLHCGLRAYREEGWRVFFRGMAPTLGHGFIAAGAIFLAYESAYNLLSAL
eukprot:evm.model.scf_2502.2 EVM.evm.TU.scf_2502.2   scf_2502:5580-9336(+)